MKPRVLSMLGMRLSLRSIYRLSYSYSCIKTCFLSQLTFNDQQSNCLPRKNKRTHVSQGTEPLTMNMIIGPISSSMDLEQIASGAKLALQLYKVRAFVIIFPSMWILYFDIFGSLWFFPSPITHRLFSSTSLMVPFHFNVPSTPNLQIPQMRGTLMIVCVRLVYFTYHGALYLHSFPWNDIIYLLFKAE